MNISVCQTPICQHAGSEYAANLAPNYRSIDPCTNFDAYVCDGWRARHTPRPDQFKFDALALVADEGELVIKVILEGPYPGEGIVDPEDEAQDRENHELLQRAYSACMNVDHIREVGIEPLKAMLTELNGTFEASKPGEWAGAFAYLARLGINVFFRLSIGADDKDPDTQVIKTIPLPDPGYLPGREFYQNSTIVARYTTIIDAIFASLNDKVEYTPHLAAAVVALENEIGKITPSLTDLRNPEKAYNPMTVEDSAALLPEIGLFDALNGIAPQGYLNESTTMVTGFPQFWTALSDLLKDTSTETLRAFWQWRAIMGMLERLDTPEVEQMKQLSLELLGRDPSVKPERYRPCLGYANTHLGWILSRFFVMKTSSATAKDRGNAIVDELKKHYIERFKQLEWMSEPAQVLAGRKVENMIRKVAYPDYPYITDPNALADFYRGLVVGDDYFNNTVVLSRFGVTKAWSVLGKPTDWDLWGVTAATPGAFYSWTRNEIMMPAGIMMFPYFHGELPDVVNYAGFGSVTGHEMTHAFDNRGRLYDEEGKLNTWWDNSTIREFNNRAQCIIDQYSNFTVQAPSGIVHIDGAATQGETIADTGGLHAAFEAWQLRRQGSGYVEQTLPGMESFSMEQLFYIAFGNVFCAKPTPELLAQQVAPGQVHPPAMWRSMGAAMYNQRGFREAFNCPVKEPVCEIW